MVDTKTSRCGKPRAAAITATSKGSKGQQQMSAAVPNLPCRRRCRCASRACLARTSNGRQSLVCRPCPRRSCRFCTRERERTRSRCPEHSMHGLGHWPDQGTANRRRCIPQEGRLTELSRTLPVGRKRVAISRCRWNRCTDRDVRNATCHHIRVHRSLLVQEEVAQQQHLWTGRRCTQ